jgi:hypothetical protein
MRKMIVSGHSMMSRIALAVILTLFVLSCALPAGYGQGGFLDDGVELMGWRMLVFGWMIPPFTLAWLANPLWTISLFLLWKKNSRRAAILSGAAMALCMGPLAWLTASELGEIRLNSPMAWVFQGGHVELRLGYFVWVGSHFMLFLLASCLWYNSWGKQEPGPC